MNGDEILVSWYSGNNIFAMKILTYFYIYYQYNLPLFQKGYNFYDR